MTMLGFETSRRTGELPTGERVSWCMVGFERSVWAEELVGGESLD